MAGKRKRAAQQTADYVDHSQDGETAAKRVRQAQEEQHDWKDGIRDIVLDKIRPGRLHGEVRRLRKKHPNRTNVQLVHDVVAHGDKCRGLARSFLQQHNILPWVPIPPKGVKTPVELASVTSGGHIRLPKKLRSKMCAHVLQATKKARAPITMADIKRNDLASVVSAKMTSSNLSCEDALLETIQTKEKGTMTFKFLWTIISRTPCMRTAYDEYYHSWNSSQHPTKKAKGEGNAQALSQYTDHQDEGRSDEEHDHNEEDGPNENSDDDDSDSDGGVSVGDAVNGNQFSVGEASSEDGSVATRSTAPSVGDTTKPTSKTAGIKDYVGNMDTSHLPPPVWFRELSPHHRQQQYERWGLTQDDAIVSCLNCGIQGHMANMCATLYPRCDKCYRCRRRGHQEHDCTNAPVIAGAFGDECDLCGKLGHGEAQCSYLFYHPGSKQYTKKSTILLSELEKRMSCYNCGSNKHWGDDCPMLPDYTRTRLTYINCWSEKAMQEKYKIIEDRTDSRDHQAYSEDGEMSDAQPSLPAHQMYQLNDYR